MRCCTICLFLNLFVCLNAKAQQSLPPSPASTGLLFDTSKMSYHAFIQNDKTNPVVFYNAPIHVLAPGYYNSTLGFFCKKEIQVEKALKFPVKIRLGSVAYTDKMEGKGAGVLPAPGKR